MKHKFSFSANKKWQKQKEEKKLQKKWQNYLPIKVWI